ncbi:actin-related protein 7 [[Candida] anglica]|uniref:Actin-related protein 7 n=1 Tax=[Candida] anglica TaxID=148631 RepID=A0ABP0E8Z7_9ASCO
MAYTSPAVVIDNGSQTTRAGFASEDFPSLVYSSNYSVDSNNKVVIGDDEIDKHPENEIMTLLDNGLVYNWDNVIHNWQYAYDNLDSSSPIDPKEYPLMLTEPSWNTKKNKLISTQMAFETLEVPIFSLVKTPLAQLFHQSKATGLIVDIGSAITSITPILDGIIQTKAAMHSKYAGDFASLHSLNYLSQKVPSLDHLLPKPFISDLSNLKATASFKNFQITNKVVEEFRYSMLQVSELPATASHFSAPAKSFYLPYGENVQVQQEQFSLLEPLFQPSAFQLPNLSIPAPAFDKPATQGLTHIILSSLKALEASIIPQAVLENTANTSANSSHHARFNDILRELLSNILITGGTSLTPGLTQRVLHDLYKSVNQFFPNYLCTQPGRLVLNVLGNNQTNGNDVWDKKFGSWIGACNLASMLNSSNQENDNGASIALDNWYITKSEYEELGEDLILEKFK